MISSSSGLRCQGNDPHQSKVRPVDYTPAIGGTICDQVIEGKGLREICAADPAMPKVATVLRWLLDHEEFRNTYKWAREALVEDLRDETREIAHDNVGEYVERVRRDGNVVIVSDRNHAARTALRCDIRHWVADQLTPKYPTEPLLNEKRTQNEHRK